MRPHPLQVLDCYRAPLVCPQPLQVLDCCRAPLGGPQPLQVLDCCRAPPVCPQPLQELDCCMDPLVCPQHKLIQKPRLKQGPMEGMVAGAAEDTEFLMQQRPAGDTVAAAVAMLVNETKVAVDIVAGAAATVVPVRQQRQVKEALEGAAEGVAAVLVTQQEPPLEREAAAAELLVTQ